MHTHSINRPPEPQGWGPQNGRVQRYRHIHKLGCFAVCRCLCTGRQSLDWRETRPIPPSPTMCICLNHACLRCSTRKVNWHPNESILLHVMQCTCVFCNEGDKILARGKHCRMYIECQSSRTGMCTQESAVFFSPPQKFIACLCQNDERDDVQWCAKIMRLTCSCNPLPILRCVRQRDNRQQR